jgi:hypothetical protein
MDPRNIDPALIERRLEQISEGLKEGVRREVERLRRLGLTIYVETNGKVIALQPQQQSEPRE